MGPSFEELVIIKRENIPSHKTEEFKGAVEVFEFKKGIFETVHVGFIAMPEHEIVIEVAYRNRDGSLTPDKMRNLLTAKYGDDIGRKNRLERMADMTGSLRDHHQEKLDTQRRFVWYNRDEIKKRRTQTVQASVNDGSRSGSSDVKLGIGLSGEQDLQTLQDEQIQSRLGATTTTTTF